MNNFEKALKRLLVHEGGYVNIEADNGGETYKGITRKFYGKWGGWKMIDKVDDKSTLEDIEELNLLVADFYYTFFWYKIKAHLIEDAFVAEMLFVVAVNLGKKATVKKLQRILDVSTDGLIGNITIAAINSHNRDVLVYHFLLEVIDLYAYLANTKPSQRLFLRGWINRAMSQYTSYEKYKAEL